ncbi:HNH endonuclease signature motif containing protein, partial [Mycolicibacterium arseniciresistens]
WVDQAARADAEGDLARWAQGMCPEDLQQLADHLVEVIDPDGAEPDHDTQQAKRGLKMGRQRRDGMTPVSGHLDPEARALFDVVFAKLAAPGQNLPADPAAAEANSAAAFGGDPRTREQRQHDALKTALRDVVGSGILGQVNGLPATIVATTTVGDLEAGTGYTHTAGGARLPIRDLIRMAGRSRHYLAVFDDHTEEILYLGRARRCATTAQRFALFARDRGCTRPGCTAPAYQTQVHHAQRDWAAGGRTDIDELALACQPDNNLIEQTEWTTRRRNGRTEWIPPPTLDTGQHRTNNYHHPRRHLTDRDDDAEPA